MGRLEQEAAVGRLDAGSLAAASEVVALAALAYKASDGEAFRALAGLAGQPGVLDWVLLVGGEVPNLWQYVTEWPASVPVSSVSLRDAVLAVLNATHSAPTSSAAQCMSKLLPCLEPGDFRRKVARSLLGDGTPEGLLRAAARETLAGSPDRSDRQALRRDARAGSVLERVARLARLGPSLSGPAELDDAAEALTELAAIHFSATEDVLGPVRSLAAMLDDKRLRSWLTGPWPYPAGRVAVVDSKFGELLQADRLCALLTKGTPGDLVDLVCAAAEGTEDWEGEARVLVRAYELGLKPENRHALRFTDGDGPLPEAVWTVALAAGERELNRTIGDQADEGQLAAAAAEHSADPRMVEVMSAVAGQMADREHAQHGDDGPGDMWATEVRDVYAALGEPFVVLLADYLHVIPIPVSVLDIVLDHPTAVREWAGCGFTDQVVARAADTGGAAVCNVLEALADELDTDTIVGLARTLLDQPGLLAVALGHLGPATDAVRQLASAAVESLDGPEAGHAPTDALSLLVPAAVSSGMARTTNHAAHIHRLLEHPDSRANAAGVAWAAAIPVTDADTELVDVVVAADDALLHQNTDLAAVRDAYATQVAGQAKDQSLSTDARAANLTLAVKLSPAVAREAAFTICEGSTSQALRKAAAGVLASTPGAVEDVDRLRSLYEKETRDGQKSLFQTALHNVQSRDITEALDGLTAVLGLPGWADARTLVPDPDFDNAFVAATDKVRAPATNRANPSDFGTKSNVLADLLVDLALLAAHDAGEKGYLTGTEAAQIRANAHGRPESGDLVHRPNLLAKVGWLGHCQALRAYRDAHPAPRGTVEPNRVTPDDSGAIASILSRVVTGWAGTMRQYHRPDLTH